MNPEYAVIGPRSPKSIQMWDHNFMDLSFVLQPTIQVSIKLFTLSCLALDQYRSLSLSYKYGQNPTKHSVCCFRSQQIFICVPDHLQWYQLASQISEQILFSENGSYFTKGLFRYLMKEQFMLISIPIIFTDIRFSPKKNGGKFWSYRPLDVTTSLAFSQLIKI